MGAIRRGEVDALVVSTPQGDRTFTLESADYSYRVFIEAMHEGAVTLGPDGTILYCNQRFSEIVKTPLKELIGFPLKKVHRNRKPGYFRISLPKKGTRGWEGGDFFEEEKRSACPGRSFLQRHGG